MSTDAKPATTSRDEASTVARGKSFWIVLVIACVFAVYSMAAPWMNELSWPGVLTGESETIGTAEEETTGALGFSLGAGLYLAGIVGLLGLALLVRSPSRQERSRLRLLAGAALAIGAVGVLSAFLEVADANVAAAESYFDALSDREKLDLIWGGAEAISGNGLNNAVVALSFAVLPVGMMLGHSGPRLLAGLGAVLALASFAVPWRSATALYADRIEYHDFWFTVHSGKFSWLLLVGTVVLVGVVVAVFRTRGAAQAVLGLATVVYFLVLFVASLWLDEYQPDQDRLIEASLADARHVHVRDPAWLEALTPLLAGVCFLLGAALWQWRATARRRPRTSG